MRIALVIETFDLRTGGLATWTKQFAEFLAGRGHDVHIVTMFCEISDLPATLHVLSDAGSIFDRGRRIELCIATLNVDVVHDTGTSWSGDVFQPQTGSRLVAFRREIAGLPAGQRLAAWLHPRMIWWQICLARLERRQVGQALRVIAVSRLVAATLARQHGPALLGRMQVIHNGVDVARFSPGPLALRRDAERRAMAVDPTIPLFMMIAHNLRLKNLDTVLRALALMHAHGHHAMLAVAGGTPDAAWLAQVARLGLAGHVRFCGHLDDVVDLYAAADGLVHPTRWDACSPATLEALAAGLPVITSARNGAADAITDGHSGYVLDDPNDARSLAARMSALCAQDNRSAMARAAREAGLGFDRQHRFGEVEAVLAEAAALRARS